MAGREESRRPAEYALTQRFCQLNPRGRLGNIVIDIDHQRGLNLLDAPPPTYTTLNTASGHQQAGYLLAVPVARTGRARPDIIRMAEDVTRQLTTQLEGDPNFVGLLSRGPFHPDHVTRVTGGRLWTLAELLQCLPPIPTTLTRREANRAAEGANIEGRNCAAFDHLRHVAYRHHNKGHSGGALLDLVQQAADQLNASVFAQHPAGPLSFRELYSIVRSICRWTDSHHRPSSTRSRTHSRDRDRLTPEAAAENIRAGQAKGAATRREQTRAELAAAVVALTQQGQPVTAKNLMMTTGLTKKAIYAHSDVWN